MNEQQFAAYAQGIDRIAQENRQTAQQAAQRLELSKLLAKVIRQTSFADGHSAPATRVWLDEIQLAQNRLGPNHTIEVATSTVTGSLRREIELFIHNKEVVDKVDRNAIPWEEVRAHITRNFLNVDEQAAQRDQVESTSQAAFETEASYCRRFREVAQAGYPHDLRNADQERLLIKSFARGLKSPTVAVKMIERANPETLTDAMSWLAVYSERADAVSRLGLATSHDEPMEIGSVPMPSAPVQVKTKQEEMMDRVLQGQERLMTKIAKLEIKQQPHHKYGQPDKQKNSQSQGQNKQNGSVDPRDLPNWSPDGKPKCFFCLKYGHVRRDCRKEQRPGKNWSNGLPQQQHNQGNY